MQKAWETVMQLPADLPGPVREGEELDTAKLGEYLKEAVPGADGPLEVQQFRSGFSNLTYLLRMGERALVLRRPPVGSKVKAAHDMAREFQVLEALHPVYPAAPKPLVFCDTPGVIGAQFYVMERIEGVVLRGERAANFTCPPETVRAACESLVRKLVELHAVDYGGIGLGHLRRDGSFVERQVNGWIDRYYGSQTDDISAIEQVARWLKDNYPADSGSVLIHNDYKFDNLVLDPDDITRIRGVLDWEMSTVGDPLMDLGNGLAYWLEPNDTAIGLVPCFLTLEPGCMTRREVFDCYAETTGRDIEHTVFYYVFGLFKLAVIVQQIYYRYKQGLTKDKRFAPLIFMVGALGIKATETLAKGEV